MRRLGHIPTPGGASSDVNALPAELTREGKDPAAEDGEPELAPFDQLFLAEYGRVVAIANRVLADRAEAEDVAQEVFIDFHRRHRPDAPYASAWLHRAAVHTALNRLRGRRRRQQRERAQARDGDPTLLDPEQVVERQEDRRLLRAALARLPTRAATVLVLRYSGLSYMEVGAALGVSASQVGTRLRRAEQALRKEVHRATSV
ncbi:MAG TPA: sigma-70 family RNA polymerase sigma factor [Candidatus Dormibacteraeota bacterium]|nr:sigma-70 family RNA polymerase sigma factor [Candidatus Dormibacteraeota bacterium]